MTIGAWAQGPAAERRHLVEINTTAGKMVVELFNETPVHRDNFLKLAREHYYDSTLFHRVVPGLMIQGGNPESRRADDRSKELGQGGVDYTLPAEISPLLIHRKGALGAARPPEEGIAADRTSGSGFYLVQGRKWAPQDLSAMESRLNAGLPAKNAVHYTADQIEAYKDDGGLPHLDGSYTVFGQVVDGLEVLDRIAALPCDGRDRPLTDVRLWMRVIQ